MINIAWILSRKSSVPQVIPSWTGFNIQIRDNITPSKCSVGYLESLDFPASDISTILEILNRCLAIKDKLKLLAIVCVFDLVKYAKAVEIKWEMPDQFKDCILMLGMFHIVMMSLGIIGKQFTDAGMRGVLIQSQVLTEGSVDKALAGKMYNCSVQSCKLVYQSLHRLLIGKMETSYENDHEKHHIIAFLR